MADVIRLDSRRPKFRIGPPPPPHVRARPSENGVELEIPELGICIVLDTNAADELTEELTAANGVVKDGCLDGV